MSIAIAIANSPASARCILDTTPTANCVLVAGRNQVPQRRIRFAPNDHRRVALASTSLSSEFGDLTRCGRGERARQSRNSRIGGEKTVKNRAESLWKVRFLGHRAKTRPPGNFLQTTRAQTTAASRLHLRRWQAFRGGSAGRAGCEARAVRKGHPRPPARGRARSNRGPAQPPGRPRAGADAARSRWRGSFGSTWRAGRCRGL
jgi:hypothetical protein